MNRPAISVLMPTYNQSAFIVRAIDSLCQQKFNNWELIIIDDGSTDDTHERLQPYLRDPYICYQRLPANQGMGAALNTALQLSQAPYIAYLPSDDVYYSNHLQTLYEALQENPDAILAYSGVRYHYNRFTPRLIDGYWMQMAQVLHRRTGDCWTERQELVSDDLNRLFWNKLRPHGEFIGTDLITCEWVDHPAQRHKLIQEPIGGINHFRSHFNVPYPMRYHSTEGNFMDEVEHYRRFREREDTPVAEDGLKIVLAGELAYNPERVLALEERGHKLYGLWMPQPYWYNTVGPLPFGHVEDIPRHNWRDALRDIQPDIIYAQLNWQAVPFIWELLQADTGIPLVWHFKEGPFICLEKGTWDKLVDVHRMAQGQIFCNAETQEWYETVIPGLTRNQPWMLLDGDLPKREWFEGQPSPRISELEGGVHTVVPGRPIGLHPHTVADLAAEGIHLHFYGDFTQKQWVEWIRKTQSMAPDHLHLHPQVDQSGWLCEFSRYDAGWLHWLKSENEGDLRRATWDDLNYPARITTLVSAGLPLLQYDNQGARVATQSLCQEHDISVFFSSIEELGHKLRDRQQMEQLWDNVWRQRDCFTFDYHADRLIDFFHQVIDNHKQRRGRIAR